MHSKVPSDWLTNYIKATQLVLKIFKMAVFIPEQSLYTYYYLHRCNNCTNHQKMDYQTAQSPILFYQPQQHASDILPRYRTAEQIIG